jgi:hypothetical protein
MVVVRIEMVPLDNYDLSNNSGYATVELTSIYNDPNTWPHKVILPSFLDRNAFPFSRNDGSRTLIPAHTQFASA